MTQQMKTFCYLCFILAAPALAQDDNKDEKLMDANPRIIKKEFTVLVDLLIDETGQVVESALSESNNPANFQQLALAEVRQKKFPVKMKGGEPIPYQKMSYPVIITIQSKRTPAPPLLKPPQR